MASEPTASLVSICAEFIEVYARRRLSATSGSVHLHLRAVQVSKPRWTTLRLGLPLRGTGRQPFDGAQDKAQPKAKAGAQPADAAQFYMTNYVISSRSLDSAGTVQDGCRRAICC